MRYPFTYIEVCKRPTQQNRPVSREDVSHLSRSQINQKMAHLNTGYNTSEYCISMVQTQKECGTWKDPDFQEQHIAIQIMTEPINNIEGKLDKSVLKKHTKFVSISNKPIHLDSDWDSIKD